MGYGLLDTRRYGIPYFPYITYGNIPCSSPSLVVINAFQVGAAYLAGARWTPLIDAANEYFGESTATAIAPSPLPTGGHGEL